MWTLLWALTRTNTEVSGSDIIGFVRCETCKMHVSVQVDDINRFSNGFT